ncbi:MAG: type IV pilin N-terminal domain-containing protein [Halobacteriota archaeon]|nr:type IV pilin N-terminal domain-containing protein [Halobacteriota archaeon]
MKANQFIKEEDAVSPVIGVILMVAITVILAAVIGAFVFGMGSSISRQYAVSATANQVGDTIRVVYTGGQDASEVTALTAHMNGTLCTDYGTGFEAGTVGAEAEFDGEAGREDHVVVTATFRDNSEQVILDAYV